MTHITTIGIFIDGGYYAKINDALREQYSQNIAVDKLFNYIRSLVASISGEDENNCIITQSHYYRGRYRAQDASAKNILYQERRFEDNLIENDVVFHYKHLREMKNDNIVTVVEKGIDVWFALEAFQLSQLHRFDYVILITGDADHEMLVKKLQNNKHHVILLTWNLGPKSSTSKLLREEAWMHIELREECDKDITLRDDLCRKA